MNAAVFIVRVLLGALLLAAGALKVGHAPELAASIAGFRLLPAAIVGPARARAAVRRAACSGLYLVAGLFTRVVAAIAAAQFVLYSGAIASAVLRHIAANCGCFGPNDATVADWPHVAFDLLLAAASAFRRVAGPGALAFDRKLRSA